MLQRSCLLSHITSVCTTLTFSSAEHLMGGGGGGRPSIILNVLLPHLLNSAAHVYTVLYKVDSFPRLSMKSLNFLGRHSFLTEVFGNCSDFNFLLFANMSHPPFLKSDLHSQCPSNRSNEGLITLLRQ